VHSCNKFWEGQVWTLAHVCLVENVDQNIWRQIGFVENCFGLISADKAVRIMIRPQEQPSVLSQIPPTWHSSCHGKGMHCAMLCKQIAKGGKTS